MSNIFEVKTTSPDYVGSEFLCACHPGRKLTISSSQDPEAAARDFRERIKNYEKVYQTIDESEKHYAYIKIVDLG